jgi:hypothetical protein
MMADLTAYLIYSAEKNEEDKTSTGDQGSSGPPRCNTGIPFQHTFDMLSPYDIVVHALWFETQTHSTRTVHTVLEEARLLLSGFLKFIHYVLTSSVSIR